MNNLTYECVCPRCDRPGAFARLCEQSKCTTLGYHCIPVEDAKLMGDRPDPEIGWMFGEHLAVAKIGRGGMGAVFLAIQVSVGRYTAVKVLREDAAASPDLNERFRREAEALARLSHPHVIPMLTFGQRGFQRYLVMEYIESSRTLADLLREDVDWDTAQKILTQLFRGVQAAHAKQIIHRDIKPDNILIQALPDDPYFVRIADFGLAKDVGLTAHTHMRMGTPTYMAPEQVLGLSLGPWTDVFAIGVVAFKLLSGERAYAGKSSEEIYANKQDLAFDPTDSIAGRQLSAPYRICLQRAMAHDPALRYQGVGEFRDGLEAAIAQVEAPVIQAPEPVIEKPEPIEPVTIMQQDRRWLWVFPVALICFALGWLVRPIPDDGGPAQDVGMSIDARALEQHPKSASVKTPKPVVKTPKPVVKTPKPVVKTPKPVVKTPKPVVKTPKPVVKTPKPVVKTPKPVNFIEGGFE